MTYAAPRLQPERSARHRAESWLGPSTGSAVKVPSRLRTILRRLTSTAAERTDAVPFQGSPSSHSSPPPSPKQLGNPVHILFALLIASLVLAAGQILWTRHQLRESSLLSLREIVVAALLTEQSSMSRFVATLEPDPQTPATSLDHWVRLAGWNGFAAGFIVLPDDTIGSEARSAPRPSGVIQDPATIVLPTPGDSALAQLIAAARSNLGQTESGTTGLVRVGQSVFVVAARAFYESGTPAPAASSQPARHVNVALLFRMLSPETLAASLGPAISSIALTAADPDPVRPSSSALALRDPAGNRIGYLVWDPANRSDRWGDAALILPLLLLAAFGTVVWSAARKARASSIAHQSDVAAASSAERAKAAFIANMNHEFRTPLNAIIGFSEVMRSETLGPLSNPRYLDYADAINQSGHALLRLIADILDLSRFESGGFALQLIDLEPAHVIRDCISAFEPAAAGRSITLANSLDPAVTSLRADPAALSRIVSCLLSNAINFTPPGGHVSVELGFGPDVPGSVRVTVRDTGIGIPHTETTKVLRPFYRLAPPATRSPGSTGLGLTLAAALAQLHRGSISIDSTPGSGTAVTVVFPHQYRR